jgi:formyltetrahydrofolate synthetase
MLIEYENNAMKTYEVEIVGTTYRTYFIDAESEDDAIDRAFEEVDADWEISKAWRQNAEVSYVEEQEKESKEDFELDNLNKDL